MRRRARLTAAMLPAVERAAASQTQPAWPDGTVTLLRTRRGAGFVDVAKWADQATVRPFDPAARRLRLKP
jgi:hypothetical protein